jgi:Uma2 family endonuclease
MGTAIAITLEEFLARPDCSDGQREELIEGELIVSPSPKINHAAIVRHLRVSLANLEQHGYVIASDLSCILGTHSMPIPDLFAVRQERWATAVERGEWLEGSPELVIEVASPSNRKLGRKADIYLEFGADQVWNVYPRTKTVTVVTVDGSTEARMGETVEFQGVRVLVESIFSGAGN